MKRWRWTGVVFLLMVAVACQNSDGNTVLEPEKINGVSARDVPIKVVEASFQGDGKTLKKYIVKEELDGLKDSHDLEQGPQDAWKIEKVYEFIEYRGSDDLYYYEIEYLNGSGTTREFFRVERTDDGWKTYYNFPKPAFKEVTHDLEPHVIKGGYD